MTAITLDRSPAELPTPRVRRAAAIAIGANVVPIVRAQSIPASLPPMREGLRFGDLIGESPAMRHVYDLALRVASARTTVLVTGESGTGKGELARAIHREGSRCAAPFVVVNCASLSEGLLESELFGHERGAFTGADRRRIGRFEQARGGTIFLDEIGEISLPAQVKLLRVLQERVFERVGGNEMLSFDVRVIAATNRDLAANVRAGRFREDLFYRINVLEIAMPPLRERRDDIFLLAQHFLQKYAIANDRRAIAFSKSARCALFEHRWPGNVRELENAIERAVVLCEGDCIDMHDLPFAVETCAGSSVEASAPLGPCVTLQQIERRAIISTLAAVGGSTKRAADILDVSVRTIQSRVLEYGLARRTRTKAEIPD